MATKADVALCEPDATAKLEVIWNSADPWDYDPADIRPDQLEGLRERFEQRREQLKVLDQRARDESVERIGQLQDAVPLLFSHTTYKSYPASFVQNGRWELMNRWLQTLSTQSTANVDVSAVGNVDQWIGALHAAGHPVITSSGTTGHSSYVNRTMGDREKQRQTFKKATDVACGHQVEGKTPYFWAGPAKGWNMGGQTHQLVQEIYGAPGESFSISNSDISVADLDKLALTRKAMVDGTATPDMIVTAERESKDRMLSMETSIQTFLDRLFSYRDRPIHLFAGASMLWRIIEAGRARGLADGAFHPETIIRTGGGMKGFRGPTDWKEDGHRFFGVPANRWIEVYGMTEINSQFQPCSAGHYHCPPTIIPLILDKSGSELLNPEEGIVEGRGGFFDLQLEGRWGGVISGDKLQMNFSPCECGRKSPTVIAIARYADLAEGDDKLTCSGQIDAYVRGIAGDE